MPHSIDNVVAKLIESWWTDANERSFQYQFAFQLTSSGFDVLHVTRHCGMEFGKDIIARSADGVIHSYQLKSGFGERLKLGDWQSLSSQIDDLVALPIKHPSLNGGIALDHQPWFVINGYLNEEVIREIEDRNLTYRQRFGRELKTILLGEMVQKSISTAHSVWPTTPEINHELFSSYIDEGRKPLVKSTFFKVLQAVLPSDLRLKNKRKLNLIADSLAVVASLYTAKTAKQQNWVAQIDAWVICWGLIASVFERNGLDPKRHCMTFRLIQVILASLLDGLTEEVAKNPKLVSLESASNAASGVARVRTTTILGYVAANAIRQSEMKTDSDSTMALIENVFSSTGRIELWGEAAVPSLLAYWLAFQHHDASLRPDSLLVSLLDALLQKLSTQQIYPDPYISADEFATAVAKQDGIKLEQMESQRESFWLRAIIETLARQLWRQELARRWDVISKYACVRFEAPSVWRYLLWRSDEGTYKTEFWPEPTSWKWLREVAVNSEDTLPLSLKQEAWMTTLFLLVCPHRSLGGAINFVEKKLANTIIGSYPLPNDKP